MIHISKLVEQTHKGHVVIVPKTGIKDYKAVMKNLTKGSFDEALQLQYIAALNKMSHIRAFFGIEREYDRYYERLRQKLNLIANEQDRDMVQLKSDMEVR